MENSSLSDGDTATGDVKKEGSASPSPPVLSDFSIEHILSSAGTKRRSVFKESSEDVESLEGRRAPDSRAGGCVVGDGVVSAEQQQLTRFEWLQCTRYHPPKLPRSRRKESCSKEGVSGKAQSQQPQQRRKLGRNPRIPFSSSQVSALEQRFRRGHYLSSADVAALSSCLRLSETRVKIWFQNRRARERRDREARAAKTSEGAMTPQETSETTTQFTTPPATLALPSITDSPLIEHRLRPSVSPITGTPNHLFGFHTPALFPVHPSPISFSRDIRGSQGLTSAFIPISPHIMSQSQALVGTSSVPRTFLAVQHKIATNSTV